MEEKNLKKLNNRLKKLQSSSKNFCDDSKVLKQVVRLLEIYPTKRTSSVLQVLVLITSEVSFFRSLKPSIHSECCKHMLHEYFCKNDYVFHAGEKGDKFFIVLKGKVSVLVPTEENEETVLKKVATLGSGAAFGELALLQEKPRAASIFCEEDCHMAVLDKKSYLSILGDSTTKELQKLVEFFKKHPAFSDWSNTSLVKFTYYFTHERFLKNQYIFREGEFPDAVYFVKKGEVELSKKVTISAQHPNYNKSGKKIFGQSKNKIKVVRIAIKGAGEIIGDEEVLDSLNQRNETCKCFSDYVELLVVPSLEFARRIVKQETIDFLKSKNLDRKQAKENLINGCSKIYSGTQDTNTLSKLTSSTSLKRAKSKEFLRRTQTKSPEIELSDSKRTTTGQKFFRSPEPKLSYFERTTAEENSLKKTVTLPNNLSDVKSSYLDKRSLISPTTSSSVIKESRVKPSPFTTQKFKEQSVQNTISLLGKNISTKLVELRNEPVLPSLKLPSYSFASFPNLTTYSNLFSDISPKYYLKLHKKIKNNLS